MKTLDIKIGSKGTLTVIALACVGAGVVIREGLNLVKKTDIKPEAQ